MTTLERIEEIAFEVDELADTIKEHIQLQSGRHEEIIRRLDDIEARIRAIEFGHTNDPLGMRGQ